ncbi:transposase [Ralstonia solanacearum]|uniref:transposase n=1 Tax=Ralstonia solanacearum TaxID=305 RepID=UPI003CC5DD2A
MRPRVGAPSAWAHTDQDARWTKKHGKSFYGYKLHANVDARYKLVRRLKISAANIDDGQTLADVLDPSNTCSRVLADRGYDSGANRDLLEEHHLKDGIARRTQAGKAPGTRLKARNRAINRTRARVEHVFAGLHQLGGKTVRALTLARNTLAITLKCVVYNVKRLVWLAAHDPA